MKNTLGVFKKLDKIETRNINSNKNKNNDIELRK